VVHQVRRELGVSERRACKILGQSRSTQRYQSKQPDKDKSVIKELLDLHVKHPRYGYRRITIKLREKDWMINFKRVYRLWCQEGLKIHRKQRKKLYVGGSDNACHRKRSQCYNQIWSYDFLSERLENNRLVKLLVVIDEFTSECLAIDVNRMSKGPDVVEVLRYLFAVRGEPVFIRSENGPEFASKVLNNSLRRLRSRRCLWLRAVPGRMAMWSHLTVS